MDKKDLEKFFKNLTKEQQKQLIDLMGRINLATDINKDREFLDEALKPLFEQYPFLRECMDESIKNGQKLT